ncbi:MAG: bifunctional 5,10-methylene-tetrahydrofolate dehydrogenase/5,10-methylene-tetrahydrofolate cyclohydrolase [Tatlockia sp.]|nr:bifunctional 5,10-methylene-tetrahydrofolate dehydrogenase/5,10-methylene-tetrahydrofolate cyclohydrolase [Tatlockia sp.]
MLEKILLGTPLAVEKNRLLGKVLSSKVLVAEIEANLSERVQKFYQQTNRLPLLATVQIGVDPASTTYVNMKIKACQRIGMLSKKLSFPDGDTMTTEKVIEVIKQLNDDDKIDGILLQHPLPSHINERECFDAIDISKDVDGVTSVGYGKLAMGEPAYGSATPSGIMALLHHYGIEIEGKHAVIVGRSPILGKPMAAMLLNKNATTTICHSKTQGLSNFIIQADIIIGAVGKPNFIKDEWIKDGAVVIDAGYHPELKTGDIELNTIKTRCLAYTPVPGGVGPMTIAMLIQQTVDAAEKKIVKKLENISSDNHLIDRERLQEKSNNQVFFQPITTEKKTTLLSNEELDLAFTEQRNGQQV